MANTPEQSSTIPAATSGSRSKLLSTNVKKFLSKDALAHPQKALTVELHNDEVRSKMAEEGEKKAVERGNVEKAKGKNV
jgi:hypothetical protein